MKPDLELWGGVECTLNRVGESYFCQLDRTGHTRRLSDFQLFKDLGVRALRHPVLWEQTAPDSLDNCNWTWADESLSRLRELDITPIVGLLHHGSGPKYTDLLDENFAEKFAAYAHKVASRFPWVNAYTPINEPLTTARFSGLYGFWYPHARREDTFLKMLLNQCRATLLAMRAIQTVNPVAYYIQTDDLGKTLSTPEMSYQAEFENHRRWLGFDLLSGRVTGDHSLFKHLLENGISEKDLGWFREHSIPPSILGINHYVTSSRYLDHRMGLYPENFHGGNGRDSYADLEAIRVEDQSVARKDVLKEAWDRYGIPLALTEVQLAGTRDNQMRWFQDGWREAQELRDDGVDVRAVTAWSMLGSFDWNSLVTRNEGYYESGVFDLRTKVPRPTAMASMLRTLADKKVFTHPVLQGEGWWLRDERVLYPAKKTSRSGAPENLRRLLIIGKTGTLGKAFAELCQLRDIPYILLGREDIDIADFDKVGLLLREISPWAVVNAAGYVRVDDAENNGHLSYRENVTGAVNLAHHCADANLPYLTFSSDLVFDGLTEEPYIESSRPQPLSVYGRDKWEAEKRVLEIHPKALIIRTSTFFGPWDEFNFVFQSLRKLKRKEVLSLPDRGRFSPTYVPDLVNTCLDLLIDNESSIWHLTNHGTTSWEELARTAAQMAGISHVQIELLPPERFGWKAARPIFSALKSERGNLLPALEGSLNRYFTELTLQF